MIAICTQKHLILQKNDSRFIETDWIVNLYQFKSLTKYDIISILLSISKLISGRVERASATEMVDSGSIFSRVKPTILKLGI